MKTNTLISRTNLPSRFIHFGCWNNLNDGNLTEVTSCLNAYLRIKPIDFIVISGDNYYPDKEKEKEKEKEKPKEKLKEKTKDKTEKIKKKIIYRKRLVDGFKLLPSSIDKYMIFGNHDLVTNTGVTEYYIKQDNGQDSMIKEESGKCDILSTEYLSTINKNIDYNFFKSKVLNNNTLMLMMDTSIYCTEAIDFLKCYDFYFTNYYNNDLQDGFINDIVNEMKEMMNNKEDANAIIHKIMELQLQLALNDIRKTTTIDNIIFVGHHPILYYKFKKDKLIYRSEILKTTKNDSLVNENNSSVNYISNDSPNPLFYFFDQIRSELNQQVNYFYLCADYHLYQKGTIRIYDTTNTEIMMIKQYIVGSGGTKLDDFPDDLITSINNSQTSIDKSIQKSINESLFSIDYQFEECIREHGFLDCIIGEEITFNFISLQNSLCRFDRDMNTRNTSITKSNSEIGMNYSNKVNKKYNSIGGSTKRKSKYMKKTSIKKNRKI